LFCKRAEQHPHALEEAGLDRVEGLLLHRALLDPLGELSLHVGFEEVRELAVVSDEHHAALGHAERNEQVERVRARGLVDDHRLEGGLPSSIPRTRRISLPAACWSVDASTTV
jgi:hypothetical protein